MLLTSNGCLPNNAVYPSSCVCAMCLAMCPHYCLCPHLWLCAHRFGCVPFVWLCANLTWLCHLTRLFAIFFGCVLSEMSVYHCLLGSCFKQGRSVTKWQDHASSTPLSHWLFQSTLCDYGLTSSCAARMLHVQVLFQDCRPAILSAELCFGVCRHRHLANLYSAISVLLGLNGQPIFVGGTS